MLQRGSGLQSTVWPNQQILEKIQNFEKYYKDGQSIAFKSSHTSIMMCPELG